MLSIDHLGCSRAGHRLLDDICLAFPPETLSLVTGPNGAGKTTLLRCLAGLEAHDGGAIAFQGREIDVGSEEWKSSVAMVADDNALFEELTVEEHISLACTLAGVKGQEADSRLQPLLELLSLERYRAHRSGELSFGYRKRLAIALSLVHPAAIYLFDEPLVGLDVTALDVFQALLALLRSRGRIVIVASHIIAPLAAIADATVVLDSGRVGAAEPGNGEPAARLGAADLPWLA